jgi:hypothetical protein
VNEAYPRLRWARWLAAAGMLYTLHTVAFTWPLLLAAGDHVRAAPPWGRIDLDLHLWTLAWVSRTVVRDPLHIFDANIFYPARLTLAGSDHLLGTLPVAGPVYWLTGSPVATLNAVVLSSFPLAGLATFALVADGTGSGWAGLVAGFVYAFAPWRARSFVPVQTFSVQYLPLALLALTAYLRSGRRWLLAAGLTALTVQVLVAYYVAYAALVTVAVWLAVVALGEPRPPGRRWIALGLGLVAMTGVTTAVSWPYLLRREVGAIRTYTGALGTATVTDWLGPGLLRREEQVYLGFVPIALAAVAFLPRLAAEPRLRQTLGACFALALAGWVLCLGSHLQVAGVRVPLPYSWLAAVVPGFSSMRVALRFFTVVILGVAGLAGIGLERVRRRLPRLATVVALAVVAVLVWEYRPLEWPTPLEPVPTGDAVPEAYRWLAAHGRGGPLLELPLGIEPSLTATQRESRAMYFSTVHWLPLLNGYTAYPPPTHALLMRVARQLPEPEGLETLVNLVDVRWILLHVDAVPAAERRAWMGLPGLAVAARFGPDVILEVTRTPSADWRRTLIEPLPGRTVGGVETAPLPAAARVGRIEAVSLPDRVYLAARSEAAVRVVNLGLEPWPGLALTDEGLVALAAAWQPMDPSAAAPTVQTIMLPRDLPSQASVVLRFTLRPPGAGIYRLTLTLRQTGEGSFPADSAPPLTRTIEVLERR